ncbi:hypothetical protein LZS85_15555 [Aliivibrio fischeri]|uniref:hypothetical protein n=1 Tax=Aliivibrio fischeri TaxID=668 RepID=UPI001F4634AA|nr:hypothetical protein [Aliivibrio fischeri]MCE7567539.1 hypothetical protein [Aliivibrio fischeri]
MAKNNGTQNVVYIGDKPVKKIVRGGTKYRFPRGEALELDEQVALELLEHEGVFATPERAEKLISIRDEEEAAIKAKLESQRKAEEEEDLTNSYNVVIDGEVKDISKLPKAKLATIIASEGLDIDINKPEMKGEEKGTVEAARNRIREALHEKHGNPDSEKGE